MDKYSEPEIEAMLQYAFNGCRANYLRSKQQFKSVTNALGGVPFPEAAPKLEAVGSAYLAALRAYTTALGELSRFMAGGMVPDRFKRLT